MITWLVTAEKRLKTTVACPKSSLKFITLKFVHLRTPTFAVRICTNLVIQIRVFILMEVGVMRNNSTLYLYSLSKHIFMIMISKHDVVKKIRLFSLLTMRIANVCPVCMVKLLFLFSKRK